MKKPKLKTIAVATALVYGIALAVLLMDMLWWRPG